MKKFLFVIISVIIIGVILLTPILFTWLNVSIDTTKSFGVPELVYYTFQIIGVFATTVAVIVALFGQEIRGFFFGEKCSVYLTNGGLSENLGTTKSTEKPEAQYYDCFVSIKNTGHKELIDCQLLLQEVWYKKDENAKYKRLATYEHYPLYWNNSMEFSYNLIVGDSHRFPLIKIYPENSCQTPDDVKYTKLRMRVIGCTLDEKYTKSGYWKMKYQVRTSENVLSSFELVAQWDGTWHNRLSEMVEVVNVNVIMKEA